MSFGRKYTPAVFRLFVPLRTPSDPADSFSVENSVVSSNPKKHHETAVEDRIPLREKIGFTMGRLGMEDATHTAFGLITPIFNMILGVSPAAISTAMFIQSMLTSFLGPLIGQFSDNFRSPWGRRKPLILIFSFPLAFFSALLFWFPHDASPDFLFYWLLLILPLISLSCMFYGTPYGALSVEATTDYHERVRLGVFVGFFAATAAIGYQWIFPFIQSSFFHDPREGVRWVSATLGVICLVMSLAPFFLCPEKRYATQTRKQPKTPFLRNLKEASKNREFLIVVSIKFFAFFCYAIVAGLGMYMNTYFIFGGDVKKAAVTYGFLGTAYVVAGIVSLFLYKYLAQHLGKKLTLQIAAGILMAGCLSKLVVYDPNHPWLQLIVLIANGTAVTGLHFMTGTMFGDIIDYDEYLFGVRREALYGSLFALSEKIGGTFGGLISGWLLVWIHFDANKGAQSPETLGWMQFYYFLFPFIGALFALLAISFYNITEDRAYEIKDVLKKRNAEKAEAETLLNAPEA